eukprot:SAG25_NODE_724_length_5722_cov_3.506136_5_plen_154_part_00
MDFEGHYGASELFDGLDELQLHEYSQAPQHEPVDFLRAVASRDQQNEELLRQVKKFGKEQLNPALGIDPMTEAGAVPEDTYHRSFVLKPPGAKLDPKLKKKEPTERLRKAMKIFSVSKKDGSRSGFGRDDGTRNSDVSREQANGGATVNASRY